jgi:hypothetical protein
VNLAGGRDREQLAEAALQGARAHGAEVRGVDRSAGSAVSKVHSRRQLLCDGLGSLCHGQNRRLPLRTETAGRYEGREALELAGDRTLSAPDLSGGEPESAREDDPALFLLSSVLTRKDVTFIRRQRGRELEECLTLEAINYCGLGFGLGGGQVESTDVNPLPASPDRCATSFVNTPDAVGGRSPERAVEAEAVRDRLAVLRDHEVDRLIDDELQLVAGEPTRGRDLAR